MNRSIFLLPLLVGLAACGSGSDQSGSSDGAAAVEVAAPTSAAPLGAGGLPPVRGGLWEVSERRGDEVETERVCRAAGIEPNAREFVLGVAPPGCEKTRSPRVGGVRVVMRCVANGAVTEMAMELRGSETRFQATIETAVISPDGSRAAETTTAEARWISPCPAGVEDGEVVE